MNLKFRMQKEEVMRHFRAIIFYTRIQSTWSYDYIPLVMRILNTEEKERTGVTPAELLFGNAIQLDKIILYPPSGTSKSTEPMKLSTHMEKMLRAQTERIKVAQQHQQTHDEYHMSQFDILLDRDRLGIAS